MENNRGFKRLIAAGKNSIAGLQAAWKDEAAFRQESIALLIGLPAAGWLCNGQGWVFIALIGSILLVMIVELLNSAIEAAIDRIGPERHSLSGKAKDVASAAVMVACLLAGMVWVNALWNRF